MAGPDIPKGERRNSLFYTFDLYTTLCDLAGIEVSKTADGQSMVPLLNDSDCKTCLVCRRHMRLFRVLHGFGRVLGQTQIPPMNIM